MSDWFLDYIVPFVFIAMALTLVALVSVLVYGVFFAG